MTGNIKYQAKQIWDKLDRIGHSKKIARKKTENKGVNGHKVSEYIHGTGYKEDVIQIAKELGNFAKSNFKIKDMQNIDNDVIHKFIHFKIEDGVTNGSLKGYISKLEKVHSGLFKMPIKIKSHNNLFDRDILKNMRKDIDEFAIRTKHKNRAYQNPNLIILNIKGVYNLVAQLQLNYGLRIAEATQITSNQMLSDNKIRINGKGGFVRIIKVEQNLYNKISLYMKEQGSLSIKYEDYEKELHSAIDFIGEKYNGIHGLRYNFAQIQFEEYLKTMPYENALQKVSFDLGHKRLEITKYYLR